jgi:cell wall-associated NlpC family hydrolase
MDFEQWRKTREATPDSIVRTAMSFMGIPYLWGGTSSKGMDCSGFTKTVYQMNGIQLMRNASQQAYQGTDVPLDPDLKNLKRGDLLFFGHEDRRGGKRISHVGIYLGNKMFIHSSGMVHLSSLDPKSSLLDERRLKGLMRARRYLPE